jgi:hypothetical protein
MNKLEEIHFDDKDYRDAAEITTDVVVKFTEWLRLRMENDLSIKGCYENEYVINNANVFDYQFNNNQKVSTNSLFEYFINNHYGN